MPIDFIGHFAMLAAARIRFVLVGGLALADPEQRREWQTVRNMQVFSFWDSSNRRPTFASLQSSL